MKHSAHGTWFEVHHRPCIDEYNAVVATLDPPPAVVTKAWLDGARWQKPKYTSDHDWRRSISTELAAAGDHGRVVYVVEGSFNRETRRLLGVPIAA